MIKRTEGPDEQALRQQTAMNRNAPISTAIGARTERQASAVQNAQNQALGVNSSIVAISAFPVSRSAIPASQQPAPVVLPQVDMNKRVPVSTATDARTERQASAVQNAQNQALGVNPSTILNVVPEGTLPLAYTLSNRVENSITAIDHQFGSLQLADESRWRVNNKNVLNQFRERDRIVVKIDNGNYQIEPLVVSSGGIVCTRARATENAPVRVSQNSSRPGERRRELF